ACGKYFMGRMVQWSIFQLAAGLLVAGIGALFFPLAIIGMIVLFMLGLTPYLIVLTDRSLTQCLRDAPGLFRRSFGRLFPLALTAMLFTFFCSFLRDLPQPARFIAPLLVYIPIATLFIRELLVRLSAIMREEGALLPMTPRALLLPEAPRPLRNGIVLSAIILLPLLGAAAGMGQLAAAIPEGPKTEWRGTGFQNGFSSAFYNSNHLYATYDWMEPRADSILLR